MKKNPWIVLVFCLSINVIACKETPNVSQQNVVQENSHLAKHGKPGLAVKLENSRPLSFPSVGVANLDFNLVTSIATGTMEVGAIAREGIEILSQSRHTFSLTEGGTYHVPLQVSAPEEGRFYIDLAINVVEGGVSKQRIITAIVQVGEQANTRLQKSGNSPVDGGVIEMPARETIKSSAAD